MNELISIIIPIYKVEDYIQRCVDSLLSQTYKNIEIILVNDGSPDNCGEICEYYKNKDSRITVIHKKNGGLSDARNVGIEISSGEYLTFIDSDDWVHENYINTLYNLLKKSNSDISVCNFIKVPTKDKAIEKEEVFEFTNKEALNQLTGNLYLTMVIACGKLYKRYLFNNIRFPVGKLHEDEYTTYKLLFKAKRVIYTTAQLLYYWQRSDSIMGEKFNINSRRDALQAFEERAQFFDKVGYKELSDRTYKHLFYNYLDTKMRVKNSMHEADIQDINKNFKELKVLLRERNYKSIFKIFFEIYYIMPNVVSSLFRMFIKLKKLSGNL